MCSLRAAPQYTAARTRTRPRRAAPPRARRRRRRPRGPGRCRRGRRRRAPLGHFARSSGPRSGTSTSARRRRHVERVQAPRAGGIRDSAHGPPQVDAARGAALEGLGVERAAPGDLGRLAFLGHDKSGVRRQPACRTRAARWPHHADAPPPPKVRVARRQLQKGTHRRRVVLELRRSTTAMAFVDSSSDAPDPDASSACGSSKSKGGASASCRQKHVVVYIKTLRGEERLAPRGEDRVGAQQRAHAPDDVSRRGGGGAPRGRGWRATGARRVRADEPLRQPLAPPCAATRLPYRLGRRRALLHADAGVGDGVAQRPYSLWNAPSTVGVSFRCGSCLPAVYLLLSSVGASLKIAGFDA